MDNLVSVDRRLRPFHPDRQETPLKLADDNRTELEQVVLRHYADDFLKRAHHVTTHPLCYYLKYSG